MSADRCIHNRPALADGTGIGCPGCRAQLAAGRRGRDAGMAAAENRPAADQDRAVIDQAITYCARLGEPFSADTIRPLLPEVSGALIGARFLAASRSKLIEAVGTTQVRHAAGHARMVKVWRGTGRTRSVGGKQPSARTGSTRRDSNASESLTAPRSAGGRSRTDKAAALLAAGRVHVVRADDDGRAMVHVQGDSGQHTARRTAGGRWSCDCRAAQFGADCSHVAAAQLVTVPAGATS